MRVVEAVTVHQDLDPYLSLRALVIYAGLGIRTLRSWLHDPSCPLPHYRIGGKVLVRKSDFDAWMVRWRQAPPGDVGAALDAIFAREKTRHLLGNGQKRKAGKDLPTAGGAGCTGVADVGAG